MVKEALAALVEGQRLTVEQARQTMAAIMDGQATEAQIGALLMALRCRPATVDELTGFALTMRERAVSVATTRPNLIDTCGTGGGGRNTFNVSTAAAIVAAAVGAGVAKHGNRAMTSQCGSADVLPELGIRIDAPPAVVGRAIDEIGLGFLFAPGYHPAMKHAAGPRRELGFRTVFNLLGPVTNPAGATAQVIGVPEPELIDLLIAVLANLGRRRAMVVHGPAGVDELSLEGETLIAELRDGWVRRWTVTPEQVGLRSASLAAVAGGDAAHNAAAIRAVLAGERGPRRDFVVLNTAAALVVAGLADELAEAARLAETALDSGAAAAKLEAWRRVQG